MSKISYIALHHSGGTLSNNLAPSQNITWEQVDAAHKEKYHVYANSWSAYRSILGHWGGYNFFIDKGGNIKQFRAIGEETAAQKSYNFNTVSICLAGNFSNATEHPTPFQITAMSVLIRDILNKNLSQYAVMVGTEINVPFANIMPHRSFGADTECYGTLLDSAWGREQLIGHYITLIDRLRILIQELKESFRKPLGGLEIQCFERDERG